ncbi:hypothetical protein HK098_006049 [Nowakowskiella sp. JEL0407]|nr:hypothetical protein HK098_006049 [Nowakowskiella sp. JEL0407]
MSLVLVTATTEEVAQYVIEYSLKQNLTVRVGSPNPKENETPKISKDVELVQLDFNDTSTFTSALNGVDYVYIPSGPTNTAFIDQAKKSGVKFIVYNSSLFMDIPGESFFRSINEPSELAIKECGIPYLFMRGGEYFRNLAALGEGIKANEVTTAYAGIQTFYSSERDLAEVAVAAFLRPDELAGTTPILTHPEKYSMYDVVNIINKKLGKNVPVIELTEEVAAINCERLGFPKFVYETLFKYRRDIIAGVVDIKPTTNVEKILGKPSRSFEDWFAENIAIFQ